MTRPLTVPAADYERMRERADVAQARALAAEDALAAVMRTLRHSAGSPQENAVYARAREVLALSGRVESAEVAMYQAAYEEWERKRHG